MEERQLLSATPIELGCVYYEDNIGSDTQGDTFQISWVGGEPGTQLSEVIINTDENGNGALNVAETFFDTAPGGLGESGSVAFQEIESAGFDLVSVEVVDGGTHLRLTFNDFDPGEKFIFSIDLDEMDTPANAVADAAEFQGSKLIGTFVHENYLDAEGTGVFMNVYTDPALRGLDLPEDGYELDPPKLDLTAAAMTQLTQSPKPITLTGTVYEDLDTDHVQDAAEPGISGVTLTLLEFNGTGYVATGHTTTTDAHGDYRFDHLTPGTYQVAETQPSGYLSVGAQPGTVDGVTVGSVLDVDHLIDITLSGGDQSIENNFGEVRPASISGHVAVDANLNGLFDAGETPLAGVTIHLLNDSGNQIGTTTTDAGGFYEFTGLVPGTYGVHEVQPANYLDGEESLGSHGGTRIAPDSMRQITLAAGADGTDYDFLEIEPASVSGHVAVDLNGSGFFDAGDFALENVTISLQDELGNLVATTTTDASGYYLFDDLMPGTYSLVETQPPDYLDGPDTPGTAGGFALPPDTLSMFTLTSGQDATDYDFLEQEYAVISGYVAVDSNQNDIFDAPDTPLAGVVLELRDIDGNLLTTTTTDANGRYEFLDLESGVYQITEVQPTGYFDGPDFVGTLGGFTTDPDTIEDIFVAAGDYGVHYDFLEYEAASISGYVYEDTDLDGQRDAGEAGIAGVTLTLLHNDGTPTGKTTTTDQNGYYAFTPLQPGEVYQVVETHPVDYLDWLDTPGSHGGVAENPGDRLHTIALGSGDHGTEYNFGEVAPASISGKVYADNNDDQVQDPGDSPIAGVTIHLRDSSGNVVATTTTDSQGEYRFDDLLPGEYSVEEIQPDGYFQGSTLVGTEGGLVDRDDLMVEIVLAHGADGEHYDFTELPPGTISGYVFQDGETLVLGQDEPTPEVHSVRDGTFTPDDTPIAGVRLYLGDASGAYLYDSAGNPISTVTDTRGYFEFTGLEAGTYTVIEEHPDDYIDGIDTPGPSGGMADNAHDPLSPATLATLAIDPQNDAIIRIPVAYGEHAGSNLFSEVRVTRGEIPPPPPTPPEWDPPPGPPSQPIGDNSPAPSLVYTPGTTSERLFPGWGGGGIPMMYTWHLSVINAGHPRGEMGNQPRWGQLYSNLFTSVSWTSHPMDQSSWWMRDDRNELVQQHLFGNFDGQPLTGDFNGDGVDEIAVYIDGTWYVDVNGNGVWDQGDLWAQLGSAADQPVVGDWDGDGKDDIGIYGPAWPGDQNAIVKEPGVPDDMNMNVGMPKNVPPKPEDAAIGFRALKKEAQGDVRVDLIDHVFLYGKQGDISIAGDFNGDGVTNIGIFRKGTWFFDMDGDGRWGEPDVRVDGVGREGDLPVVGDFNGDAVDDLGIFRDGRWHLDTNGNRELEAQDAVFTMGGEGDLPVVGDFNGDGIDEPALYRPGEKMPQQTQLRPQFPTPDPQAMDGQVGETPLR